MPAIQDVAQDLLALDLPVLFLDTCILLDIIRALQRRDGKCVAQAQVLRAAISSSPTACSVVVSEIVKQEWNAHAASILNETVQHLDNLEVGSAHFHDACGVFGIAPGFTRANYSGHAVAERLHDLSNHLLQTAIEIVGDDDCKIRAMKRVLTGTPPSNKGGEAKDCTILEEYLSVCRQLQNSAFSKKRVFCTSNIQDYGKPGALHSQLQSDFDAVNLVFTTALPWGVHQTLS